MLVSVAPKVSCRGRWEVSKTERDMAPLAFVPPEIFHVLEIIHVTFNRTLI